MVRFALTLLLITYSIAYTSAKQLEEGSDSIQKSGNIIDKIIDYFNDSNKGNPDKDFDFSIIGGPHYSSETELGLGVVAAGLYKTDKADSLLQPSNISLYGDVSTIGFYSIGVKGNHISPHDKSRLNYKVSFYSFPQYFWGIGYDCGENDGGKSKYKHFQAVIKAEYLFKTLPNLYIGPSIQYNYIKAHDVKDLDLWRGEDLTTHSLGAGFSIQYDSRDYIPNAFHGIYVRLDQQFYPKGLANSYAFSLTAITANYYHKVWEDALLAYQLHSRFTYGNTPWGQLSTFGGDDTMRGYYEGRYRDKDVVDVTIELRQHIWKRHSLTCWVGAGNVFPSFSNFKLSQTLPNLGFGYRWEFKRRTNIRLDYGIGKHQSGFLFNINEAF